MKGAHWSGRDGGNGISHYRAFAEATAGQNVGLEHMENVGVNYSLDYWGCGEVLAVLEVAEAEDVNFLWDLTPDIRSVIIANFRPETRKLAGEGAASKARCLTPHTPPQALTPSYTSLSRKAKSALCWCHVPVGEFGFVRPRTLVFFIEVADANVVATFHSEAFRFSVWAVEELNLSSRVLH